MLIFYGLKGKRYYVIIYIVLLDGKAGENMKKIATFMLSLVLVATFILNPIKASAATNSSKAGIVTTESTRLIVRGSASTSGKYITSLAKGSYITLISKSGDWWYVEYGKNLYGYCYSAYITETASTAKSVKISSGTLNVRSGAGTGYSIIGSLSKEQTVLVLSESGDWSRVLYNGKNLGYVSNKYLSGQSSTASVKLNIPSYKQTDSRWANVQIGSSGKTIAQIGCATTAIAMIESYRQAVTITPDAMAKKLKYTSSGSVYWPSHYTVITSSSGYLAKIRSILSQNKPVLFGAKNKYGSQHWVVITGFKDGGAGAGDFFINDPGSNTRTTLSQFLSSYPTFYKYFSY